MQMYYEDMTGAPCDYDFTGLGQDYDASWENENCKLTLRAVTGCDWSIYYFYDVEPKQDMEIMDFWGETHLAAKMWSPDYGFYFEDCSPVIGSFSSDRETDSNVFHCYGVIYNMTGRPFFHQDDEKCRHIQFVVHSGEAGQYDLTQVTLDFADQEFPLHNAEQPGYIQKFTEYGFLGVYGIDEWMQERAAAPLNRCAETPFGIYYLSDQFVSTGSWNGTNWYSLCSVDSLFEDLPQISVKHLDYPFRICYNNIDSISKAVILYDIIRYQ